MLYLNDIFSIENVNVDEYDVIYLLGGYGIVYDFVNNEKLVDILF